MDRRRRSILSYPSYGNSPFMQIEDDSDEDNEGEGMQKIVFHSVSDLRIYSST